MNDLLKISAAIEKHNLSVVCATCTKYWKARDQNVPEPKCLSVDNCRSPIGGGTFHEYEGPMPSFEIWCIICGSTPHAHLFIGSEPNIFFGVCEYHLEDAKKLGPTHINNAKLLQRFYVKDHKVYKLNEDFHFGKTAAEQIKEAEDYIQSNTKKIEV